MLTDTQQAKLIEWAKWRLEHKPEAYMPSGIQGVEDWARDQFTDFRCDCARMPFPALDGPLTFGEG